MSKRDFENRLFKNIDGKNSVAYTFLVGNLSCRGLPLRFPYEQYDYENHWNGQQCKDGDLDLTALDIPKENMRALMDVDLAAWKAEAADIERHFALFGKRMPERLQAQLAEFKKRLG